MGLANQPALSIESITQQERDVNMEQTSVVSDAGNNIGEGSEPPDQQIVTVIKLNEKIGNLDIRRFHALIAFCYLSAWQIQMKNHLMNFSRISFSSEKYTLNINENKRIFTTSDLTRMLCYFEWNYFRGIILCKLLYATQSRHCI